MSSSPSPLSTSPSKPNTLKSLRKRLLDTFDFKSHKSDKFSKRENINIHKTPIPTPILLTNPGKYYQGGEWLALVKENFTVTDSNPSNNDAGFRFKPSPKQLSSIDNVLPTSLTPFANPVPNSNAVALLVSTSGANVRFDQESVNEWKDFFYSYAYGKFNPSIAPKRPAIFSYIRTKHVEGCRNKILKISFEDNPSIPEIEFDENNNYNMNEDDDYKERDDETTDDDDDDDDDDNYYLPPPMPPNEFGRRKALWRFQILNTSKDVNFARIVTLAKDHFKASISLISLVSTTHQWFKAEDGMGCSETTREVSFCGHAILQENEEPFVVLDAAKDWRFRNNPLVTDAPFIRFYAGAPLRTEDGYNIGTICVIDRDPRDHFSEKDREILKGYAKVVMRELELWADTLRLRVRNKMQESIAEFSKCCLETQLANNEGNRRNSVTGSTGDPIMKNLFNKAVQLMRDTLDVDSVYLVEMPCLYSRPISLSSSGFFLNAPPPDASTRHLKSLASAGQIELSSEALKATINTSYFSYLMQTHSQGCIYQNALPSLPTLFPSDIHSGIVVPIYDNSQNAFGFLIAMTKDPQRQFEEEERVYLSNFGVNVVSEVLKRRVIVADKAKGAFISSISHELRTPLHGILASCELMEESKLDEAQSELVKTVQGCGTSLISIINSVLDFAKLESEDQEYHEDSSNPNLKNLNEKSDGVGENREIVRHRSRHNKNKKERVDLVKLLEEVAEACFVGQQMVTAVYGSNNKMMDSTNDDDCTESLFVPSSNDTRNDTAITQARRKRVCELLYPHQFQHQNKSEDVLLMIDVEPRDAGWWVMAEDGAVKQMLMNIIGNSLKFTKEGYVLISLAAVSSTLSDQYKKHAGVQDTSITDPSSSKIHALITITDTGCGISRSFLNTNIFQPFSQENSLQVGTGLGLSIVKLLVEKMGGRLAVESEVGVGTRVRIWLDFDPAPSTIPEIERGLECDDLGYNSNKHKDHYYINDAEEKQRQIILEEVKKKTVVVKCVKDGKLKEVIIRYFNNWLKVKELICEENGTDLEGDIIFIIDDINQLQRTLSKVDSKLTPIVFVTVLAKHAKIAEFVEKLQQEIEQETINSGGVKRKKRKVVMLTRPCGPRKLEKAILSVFSDDDYQQNKSPISPPVSPVSPKLIMTPPVSDNDQPSTPNTPNIVINEKDNSPKKSDSLAPPTRPSLCRSTTLPNIPLPSEENNEPKFLPIPKFNRFAPSSPPASPTSPTSPTSPRPSSLPSQLLNVNQPELKKSKSANSLGSNSGPRVLVVEDNAVNRMILSTFLKKRGISYEEAENGAIGVEKFRKALADSENPNRRGFDVVLMDIQMPVMNGNVATSEIRKIENEFKNPNSFPFSFSTLPTETDFTQSPTDTTAMDIPSPINDSATSGFSSFFNNSTKSTLIPISDSNNCLKPINQKNKLIQRRVSNPDTLSLQNNQNNHFSITNLLKPKMTIKLPKTSTKQRLSPLPSPVPSSPSFTTSTSRALIFALTGLASEEDKDIAFESGVDGFLTKPVSLKMLERVFKKWSERNEFSSENCSVGSNNSSSSGEV